MLLQVSNFHSSLGLSGILFSHYIYLKEMTTHSSIILACAYTHTHTHTVEYHSACARMRARARTHTHTHAHTQWNATQPYVCVYNTTSLFICLLMYTGLLSYVGPQRRLSAKELMLSTLVLEKILESLLDFTN